jgi:hypothetical protein
MNSALDYGKNHPCIGMEPIVDRRVTVLMYSIMSVPWN